MPEEVIVKIHPPIARVGILCLDGGSARGALSLRMIKRIHDRIGMPIPF